MVRGAESGAPAGACSLAGLQEPSRESAIITSTTVAAEVHRAVRPVFAPKPVVHVFTRKSAGEGVRTG